MSDVADGLRLHPAGLLIGFIAGLPNLALPIIAAIFGARGTDMGSSIVIPIIAGVMLLSLFFRWLAWMRFRYIIGEEDIRIESGILNRNARSIPYERIQDVSIEQRLLARIMGLGEVKFETGGGEGEDAKLAFVSMQEGERLREVIKERKAPEASDINVAATHDGAATYQEAVTEANGPPSTPIFAMDIRRVLTFGLFEFSLVIFAVLLGLTQQFQFLLPLDILDPRYWFGLARDNGVEIAQVGWTVRLAGLLAAMAAIIVLGVFTGVLRTLFREYGFRLDRTAKGFRRRRGLTTLTDVVMPIHRVQAAIIHTGFFRKRFGWHGLKLVSLAQDSKEEASHAAAPFAQMAEIADIARQAGISLPDKRVIFRRQSGYWWFDKWLLTLLFLALASCLTALIFSGSVSAPIAPQTLLWPICAAAALIALLMWLDWRHNGYASAQDMLYAKSGWWSPEMTAMQQVKIQSVEIYQGPAARLRGLAKIHFGIAGGRLSIPGLPIKTAQLIRKEALAHIVMRDFTSLNAA